MNQPRTDKLDFACLTNQIVDSFTVALLLLAAPDIRAAVERGGLVEGVIAKRSGIARDQVAVGVVRKTDAAATGNALSPQISADSKCLQKPDKTNNMMSDTTTMG